MKTIKDKKLTINATLNVLRQLVAIVFPLITFPYVSRILGVDNYGMVNYTASIISYVSLIAGLGITNYAIREGSRLKKDYNKFIQFVREIFTLNFLALILSYVFLIIVMFYYRNNDIYRWLLLIQGAAVFFTVIGCEWLNVIFEDYLFITLRYILFQSATLVLIFLFVKSSNDLIIYAFVSQLGGVFANVCNLIHFYNKYDVKVSFTFSKSIFSHLKYVLILFANSISMLIYVNSDITILGLFKGDYEVGLYSVAVKIYTIVKQLLNAMMVVGMPRMVRWTGQVDKKIVDNQLNGLLSTLLMFLLPSIIGLFCLSEPIINLMAGETYILAAEPLRILSITLLFATIVCFYSNLVLIPNNMERKILKATSISAVLNIVLNIIFIPAFGMKTAAFTTLVSEGFSMFYMVFVSRKLYVPSVIKTGIQSLLSAIVIGMICLTVVSLSVSDLYKILISIVASGVFWLLYWACINLGKKLKNKR